MLDPYKRHPSDFPITTPNHLIHCHNRTSQLLQTGFRLLHLCSAGHLLLEASLSKGLSRVDQLATTRESPGEKGSRS